jgi:hypothetical protein
MPADVTAPNPSRSHLRLVSSEPEALPDRTSERVRATRRAMARLLRAVQASGRSVTAWPDEIVTRLAHVDAVTARYLIDPTTVDVESALQAALALGVLRRWVMQRLSRAELASVRAFELMIRIDDAELEAPLLRPDRAPEEQSPTIAVAGGPRPRSLRAGLRSLDDEALAIVCRRLGLRPLEMEANDVPEERATMEAAVARTLRDDHLLSILVATFSAETHELLAALVRGYADAVDVLRLAGTVELARVAGGAALVLPSPLEHLRGCGLAYGTDPVWVPVELQRRVDGVLRAFGI